MEEKPDLAPSSYEPDDDARDFIRSHMEFIEIQKDKIVHRDPSDEIIKIHVS